MSAASTVATIASTVQASPSTRASSVVDSKVTSSQGIVFMRNRIKHLEEQLHKASSVASLASPSHAETAASNIETTTSQMGGTFHIHHPSPTEDVQGIMSRQAQAISRNISHKTRLFGQSHWANTMAPVVRVWYSFLIRCIPLYIGTLRKCARMAASTADKG